MERGNILILQTFDNRQIKARLIAVKGRTALVCSEQEWDESQRQGCDPIAIGWPLENVRQSSEAHPSKSIRSRA